MTTTFSYFRGEPVMLDLVVADPGEQDVTALSLAMRMKLAPYGVTPARNTGATQTFNVAFQSADGGKPAYWRASLPDSASADLVPGTYVTDGQVSAGSTVIAVTQPLFIKINESVTPA